MYIWNNVCTPPPPRLCAAIVKNCKKPNPAKLTAHSGRKTHTNTQTHMYTHEQTQKRKTKTQKQKTHHEQLARVKCLFGEQAVSFFYFCAGSTPRQDRPKKYVNFGTKGRYDSTSRADANDTPRATAVVFAPLPPLLPPAQKANPEIANIVHHPLHRPHSPPELLLP